MGHPTRLTSIIGRRTIHRRRPVTGRWVSPVTPWWERDPARWENEQHALRDGGIQFEINPAAFAAGKLELFLKVSHNGQLVRLTATFPVTYPYFAPMVIAMDLALARHQTPGTKQLCLLDRGGDRWLPQTDRLASLILEKLPEVFASQPDQLGTGPIVEALEGEPITIYLQPELNSFVGFPDFDLDALAPHGNLHVGVDSFRPFRATVLDVTNADGKPVAFSQARQYVPYNSQYVVAGRWVKLPQRPNYGDAASYYRAAIAQSPELEQPKWQTPWGDKGPRMDLIALLFEDEMTWRGNAGNVIVVAKTQEIEAQGKRSKVESRLLRAELESQENYFLRNPTAERLHEGVVTLVGTGSIGSPAAKLLAQAGVGTLRLFDPDVVEAGNAIRWEIGRTSAGYQKVAALQGMLMHNFPYTKVEGYLVKLGDPAMDIANHAKLEKTLFGGTTCILDASASTRVNQYLAETAQLHGIPYVWMSATNGGWGGLVGIAVPGRDKFCWMCHLYYLHDKTIDALPHAPDDNLIQPPGCLDPTFTGSQVDLTEVSLMATRVVMDQVTASKAGVPSVYPWNVATLQLRDQDGRPHLPVWTPHALPPHANCPNH